MNTKELRQKILDLAIRGKLVPQDPNDEPASVLLEQIRAEKQQMVKDGRLKAGDIKNDSAIFIGDDSFAYEKFPDGTVKCIEDELPFELPEGWEWTRLSSACIINPKNNINDEIPVSFVPMTLIQDGFANQFTYIKKNWGEVKKGFTHFAENDVGFAKITPCFENRKSVIFRGLFNGYGVGTTELYILRTIKSTILPEYLLYLVKTESFISGGKQAFSGAVGQQRVGKEFVYNYLCPLPPLAEQHRIADKLSEIMSVIDKIENNKTDILSAIQLSRSKILDLAIRGKLVPQDPSDEPASVLLEYAKTKKEEQIRQGKIKRDKNEAVIFKNDDNSYCQKIGDIIETLEDWEIDNIPESWGVCCLGEVCDYGNCISVDAENISEKAWILDLEDIEKDTGKVLQKITKKERNSASTKHLFHKGQVLYSKLRPYLNKVVMADDDGYCTSEILPLEFNACILPEYARYYLMSPTFLRYANHCSYGVKMPRLGTSDGKKAVLTVPPLNEQKRIADKVSRLFSLLDSIEENIN